MTARSTARRGAVALALLGALLAGCSSGTAATAAAPASASAAPVPADPDAAACRRHAAAAPEVRRVLGVVDAGPVLPAGVAFLLLAPRNAYATPGARDASVAAAMTEMVAAIDDLDAQGRTRLPAGGNPAGDKVQLDAARITAALETADRVCAGRT